MSSRSWPEDLRAWLATRLLRTRIVVLWLALSGSMLAVAPWRGPARTATGALLVALLIAQFRLWDDLADRSYDAHHHTQRVLTTSAHGTHFGLLCVGVALPVLGLLLTLGEPGRPVAYMLLCAAVACLYLASPAWPRLLRAQLVLLKYPFCVWLAASGLSLAAGMALWLALAAYELLTDKALQTGKYWRALAAIECLSLFALAARGVALFTY